ncbi:catalase-related domain-containing protein [Pedobacter hiemivivus]|nr:catalase-related domain-containing protein [Pedobacter hiemivivus]
MRTDGNYGSNLSYEPNSFGEWKEQPEHKEPPLKIEGDAYAFNYREDDDDYFSQPGNLFRKMNEKQKQLLFDNTATALGGAQRFIQVRHIRNCFQADPTYGTGVALALGMTMTEVESFTHPNL